MKVTLVLIALCIIGYIAMVNSDPDKFIEYYGFSGENLIERPWVVFTSIFVHADLNHLISNILVLFFFGLALERELKWYRFLAVFFFGALAGEMLSLLAYPWSTVGIGASAGIFAIIGAGILLTPFDLSLYPYLIPIPLGVLGIIYAIYNIIAMFHGEGNISYIAHIGGLLFGLWYGFRRRGMIEGMGIIVMLTSLLLLGLLVFNVMGWYL